MISRVEVEVKDSKSGLGAQYTSGIHGKIGISPVGGKELVTVKNTMDTDRIKELLGESPLADACIDSVDGGAQTVYCLPVAASAGGEVSEVSHTGEGKGTVTVSGTSNNSYDIVIRIVEGGATNRGTFEVSMDGGASFGEEETIPLSGEYELADTGLKLTFADGGGSFETGDTYGFHVSAPAASNEAILAALDTIYKSHVDIEFLHIVGTTDPALWAALEVKAQEMEDAAGRPLVIICEQREASADEDAAAYFQAIKEDCRGAARHVAVVQTWARIQRMDGRVVDTNIAGYVCGMIARGKESSSIAFVRDYAISEDKVLKLLPEGIEELYEELDAARYIALRRYPGKDAWYVAAANTCAPENSDFASIENVRVMYRLVREVYKRAVEWQNADFDAADIETETAKVQADINIPIDAALEDKVISSGEAVILDPEALLTESKIPVRITYQPRAYARTISLTFMAGR